MTDPYLAVEGLTRTFDAIVAVDDVTLDFPEDTITAIIGPNGAGKTTMFNLLTGVLAPTSGEIRFRGDRIDQLGPEDVAKRGIVRSYQVTNIFPRLSVHENVRLAAQSRDSGFGPGDFLTHYSELESAAEEATAVLERVELTSVADDAASTLSHGQQRHLDIAIALATNPKVLLLDEPTAGMSVEETRETTALIEEIANDITVVIIEHDMEVVMDLSDRVAVMNGGQLITIGSPDSVSEDERVQKAYLTGGVA
jgi:branched-chain amino acid transport system ATP-binding protein